MAVLAHHSILVSELTRNVDDQNPRTPALMVNLKTWKKTLLQEKLLACCTFLLAKLQKNEYGQVFQINILLSQLPHFLQICYECFQTRRNRTMERHTFFSRKQKPTESLHQLWTALDGLAANCNFGNQTENWVYDKFVRNMSNGQVQENFLQCQKRLW